MDHGEVALFVEGLERCKRGMEAKEAIEINDLVLRNGNAGPHGVIVGLAVGDDDVETVDGSALEDHDEAMSGEGCGLCEDGADEETGESRSACDGEGAVA
jgi:hypothetical protein